MVTEESGALEIEGLVNLRDLGGLPVETGGHTRYGRLLRSDSPHDVTESGRRTVTSLGVNNIVDLRTASERESRPNPLLEIEGMRCVHAPIFTDDDVFPGRLVTAADVYCWWLSERSAGIAVALSAVADSPSAPILVHCHAGKDRTGIVIALVLLVAGVGVDAVADDYAQSGVQLAPMLARDRVSAVKSGMDERRAERLFTVRREAMVESVKCIESDHGGTAKYMRTLGLDPQRIDRLGRLLVAREWP